MMIQVQIEIYDIMGREVNSNLATKKAFTLEIDRLEKGLYFVKANTVDYNICNKLIVK